MNINRDEALRRLQSPNNLANRLNGPDRQNSTSAPPVAPSETVDVPEKPESAQLSSAPNPYSVGRGTNVPEGRRDLIARAALLKVAPQAVIADRFGVSTEAVKSYKSGDIGRQGLANMSLEKQEKHAARVKEVRDLALEKTMAALGLIDGAKLENLEAKDLGKFAKDMAGVYNSLAPKDAGDNRAPIQLLVYAPQVQTEDRYKVVDV